jgi:hypothetical protein
MLLALVRQLEDELGVVTADEQVLTSVSSSQAAIQCWKVMRCMSNSGAAAPLVRRPSPGKCRSRVHLRARTCGLPRKRQGMLSPNGRRRFESAQRSVFTWNQHNPSRRGSPSANLTHETLGCGLP